MAHSGSAGQAKDCGLQEPPRLVRMTKRAYATRFFLVGLMVVLPLLFIWHGASERDRLGLLAAQGTQTTGKVTERTQSRSSCMLRYSYEISGKQFGGSAKVDSEVFDATPVGSPVSITYLASDPQVHQYGQVKPDDGEGAENRYIGFGLMAGTVLLAGVLYTECVIRRQKWLCEYGTATIGTVTAQTGGKNRKTHYAYTPAGESPRQGKAQATFATVKLPAGARLTILYDPKAPGKSWPYEAMGMARIVKSVEGGSA